MQELSWSSGRAWARECCKAFYGHNGSRAGISSPSWLGLSVALTGLLNCCFPRGSGGPLKLETSHLMDASVVRMSMAIRREGRSSFPANWIGACGVHFRCMTARISADQRCGQRIDALRAGTAAILPAGNAVLFTYSAGIVGYLDTIPVELHSCPDSSRVPARRASGSLLMTLSEVPGLQPPVRAPAVLAGHFRIKI